MPGSAGEYKPIGLGSGLSAIAIGGGTPITGGTNTCILFDKAGVVGEDTNLEWDYTNHILNVNVGASNSLLIGKNNPNSNYNTLSFNNTLVNTANLGFTAGSLGDKTLYFQSPAGGGFSFQVNATQNIDWNITSTNFLTVAAGSGSGPGYQLSFNGAVAPSWAIDLDGSNNPIMSYGPGTTALDISFTRIAAATLGLFSTSNHVVGTAFQVYNTIDAIPPTNYERGVFDWTTTPNVLTIGTQKGGTGSTRNIQFVAGNSIVLDYNITIANSWSALYWQAIGGSGSFTGNFVRLFTDAQQRIFFALDGANNPVVGLGAGTLAPDTVLYRLSKGVLSLSVTSGFSSQVGAAGFQVYNVGDFNVNFPPVNYERAVFDWTTTSNVLTIGTQANGAGSLRDVHFVGNFFRCDITANVTGRLTVNAAGGGTNNGFGISESGTEKWSYSSFNNAHTNRDFVLFNDQSGRSSLLVNGDTDAIQVASQLSVSGDTGGIASTNTISNTNSTTIGAGTGTVKMSSANNANNTGWLKCYIGTQVAWIPCWTTNAP